MKVAKIRAMSLTHISDKAVLIKCFDGSQDVLPISQITGIDEHDDGTHSVYAKIWIMKSKSLQYKKVDDERVTVYRHKPERVAAAGTNPLDSLIR